METISTDNVLNYNIVKQIPIKYDSNIAELATLKRGPEPLGDDLRFGIVNTNPNPEAPSLGEDNKNSPNLLKMKYVSPILSKAKYIPPNTDRNVKYLKYKRNNYRNLYSLKKLIFPQTSEDIINQLMIDEESIKYITFATCAQETSNIIMNNLNDFPCPFPDKETKWNRKSLSSRMSQLVVTDMTAGVGGNVLNFAKYFKYVNAIELDHMRYIFLNKNIKLYGFNNVNCYNDDSIHLLIDNDDIVQDIIFFDPPWGGKDYKLYDNLRLNFGKFTIEDICKILFRRNRNKLIVLKLPNNYDFTYMQEELKEFRVSKFILERMTIIVAKNYPCCNDI